MCTIIKEKNYLIFTNNQNQIYKFDINEGIFYSASTNKPLKNAPNGFSTFIKNGVGATYGYHKKFESNTTLLNCIYYIHYQNQIPYTDMSMYKQYLMICDKLDSIGYSNNNIWRFSLRNLDFVNENFKAFSKMFNENPDLTLDAFQNVLGRERLMNSLKLKEDEYYTPEILDLIWNWRNGFSKEELKYVAYYLSRGVYEFYHNGRYFNGSASQFRDFFTWSNTIGYKPTKDDFFHQYLKIKKTYKTNKTQYDNKALQYNLNRHSKAWDFENDEFQIIVPKTSLDFKNEAEEQGNCVYSAYLKRVISGDTNIIFVRQKSNPNHSYITCEVDNEGRIRQYLGKYNNRFHADTKEMKFANEFQKHIYNNWIIT